MKKSILSGLVFLIFYPHFSSGQGGVWTWISGTNTLNPNGVYGIQGVPSVNNHPPGEYECAQWKDHQGNFWLYGGNYPAKFDLWKYNSSTNEWTWVNGVGSGLPYAGPKGVFGPMNTPGYRVFGSGTWVDTTGNLWLFGGYSPFYQVGELNDLWQYNISLNQWAWMGGNNFASGGYHGTKGIPSANVDPGCRDECTATWTDSLNNLWLFGGYGYDDFGSYGSFNDLMKYDISTGEWTWVSGSSSTGATGSYGTQGVPDTANVPGARFTCSDWKDSDGNFWFIGGATNYWGGEFNDVWKYEPSNNIWTWIGGPQVPYGTGTYNSMCVYDSAALPRSRFEHHAVTTDFCGKFFLFGGASGTGPGQYSFNDLWVFDPAQDKWNWLSGTSVPNQSGNYGTLGVPSVSNIPPSKHGANAWWGNDNRFYLFGGMFANTMVHTFNDLWVFTTDSNCISTCTPLPVAGFNSQDHFCPGICTNFVNLSLYADNYQWNFPGAVPDTSTAMDPNNICYPTPGNYDVSLIVSNATGSDTLTLHNYITVYPIPPPQAIIQIGDTLFANSGASSYQWFFNGTLISGATDYFYVATANGDYNVVATDANGCEVEAAIFNIFTPVQPYPGKFESGLDYNIYPNPVNSKLTVINTKDPGRSAIEIFIYTTLGVCSFHIQSTNCDPETNIDVSSLPSGMYYVIIISDQRSGDHQLFRTKFVKQ